MCKSILLHMSVYHMPTGIRSIPESLNFLLNWRDGSMVKRTRVQFPALTSAACNTSNSDPGGLVPLMASMGTEHTWQSAPPFQSHEHTHK